MEIVIINKTDTQGGAAIAANRLVKALSANGERVLMLVQIKQSADIQIHRTKNGRFGKYYEFALFVFERLYFYFFEKSKSIRFAFSPAFAGEKITKHKLVKSADIIHLHWFNQGFLSLKNLHQILRLKKPIVWTLHDMWAFTGGCHYSGDCENYKTSCGNCKFLNTPGSKDLSNKILNKKTKIFKNADIKIVTCSEWLARKARESALLKDFNITSIPNPIDTSLYFPKNKLKIREKLNLPLNKKLLLFGSANVMDERKGLKYLVAALQMLKQEKPEIAETLEIVLFGKSSEAFLQQIPFKIHDKGLVYGDLNIIDIYNAADLFVLPSLEDNLPNTIMESMACGTPVLAFNTGGIPEMIDHKVNGYLAEYKSVDDLKDGIVFTLENLANQEHCQAAVGKVYQNYRQEVVAEKYKSLYR